MIGLSPSELIVLAILIVFLIPSLVPRLAKRLGKTTTAIRRYDEHE